MKFGDFIVHWSIAVLKFFKENLCTNFGLIAVFMKVALENTKTVQYCVWLQIHMFSCFWNSSNHFVFSRLWSVLRSFAKRLSDKNFQKHPKTSEFVCVKSSLQFMHNLYPFWRNSAISRNFSYRFLWNLAQQKTSTQSIGTLKHFQQKCLQGQEFDLELKLLWCLCHVIFNLFRSRKQ